MNQKKDINLISSKKTLWNKIFLIKTNNKIKAIGLQRLTNILELFKVIKNWNETEKILIRNNKVR